MIKSPSKSTSSKPEETAEEIEAQALRELSGYQSGMKARTEAAFDKSDQIRIFAEGLIESGTIFPRIMTKLIQAGELRFKGLFRDATVAAEAHRKAAEAAMQADLAKASKTLSEQVVEGSKAMVAADRRLRGWRAYGLAGVATVALLGAGMLIEHWRSGYYSTIAVGASIEQLQQQLNTAVANVSTIKEAADSAGSALAILRTVGNLPPEEYAVAQNLLAELAKPPGARQGMNLAALRELLKLPADRRTDALRFALIDDANIRSNMIAIADMAASRNGPWFPTDRVYRGCLASGPSLPTEAKTTIRTCLVRLPDNWQILSDEALKQYYQSVLNPPPTQSSSR